MSVPRLAIDTWSFQTYGLFRITHSQSNPTGGSHEETVGSAAQAGEPGQGIASDAEHAQARVHHVSADARRLPDDRAWLLPALADGNEKGVTLWRLFACWLHNPCSTLYSPELFKDLRTPRERKTNGHETATSRELVLARSRGFVKADYQ